MIEKIKQLFCKHKYIFQSWEDGVCAEYIKPKLVCRKCGYKK